MIYQQDWLMRQIEAMIQAVLAVALGISANEQTATQIEDSSYGKMLEKMIDDGDICAAEDFHTVRSVFLSIMLIRMSCVFCSFLCLHISGSHTVGGDCRLVDLLDCAFYDISRFNISH